MTCDIPAVGWNPLCVIDCSQGDGEVKISDADLLIVKDSAKASVSVHGRVKVCLVCSTICKQKLCWMKLWLIFICSPKAEPIQNELSLLWQWCYVFTSDCLWADYRTATWPKTLGTHNKINKYINQLNFETRIFLLASVCLQHYSKGSGQILIKLWWGWTRAREDQFVFGVSCLDLEAFLGFFASGACCCSFLLWLVQLGCF